LLATTLAAVLTDPAFAAAQAAEFVDSETCSECHQREYADWREPDHHKAMQARIKLAAFAGQYPIAYQYEMQPRCYPWPEFGVYCRCIILLPPNAGMIRLVTRRNAPKMENQHAIQNKNITPARGFRDHRRDPASGKRCSG
jgi:hypothetical protein